MIKAVFIDIDETLTNSQREVTEKTKLEIKKCVENGVKIILTSGRSRREAMDFQEQIAKPSNILRGESPPISLIQIITGFLHHIHKLDNNLI